MIQFADNNTSQQVWDMWKAVFGDSDNYMEVYFRYKYSNENTLLYMEDDKAVSSLQMLSYKLTFCGSEIPVLYLSGVCTLPGYRGSGYSSKLILKSFEVAVQRNTPLVLLVPQEQWLISFYKKYGFAQTFDAGKYVLPSLNRIIKNNFGNLQSAYKEFDNIFRNKDVTVQKTFDDFKAIAEEAALFDFPPKKNLRGMARLIDAESLLKLFAIEYPNKKFSLTVSDEIIKSNNNSYIISGGHVEKNSPHADPDINIRDLVQSLMGYHTFEKTQPLSSVFPEKTPVMNFMLE